MGSRGVDGPRRADGGYSFVEILIVVSLLGILSMVAGPTWVSSRQRATVRGAAEQLLGDLERARSEALKRSRPVTLRVTGSDSYEIDFIGEQGLDGAVLSDSPDSIRFAPLGPPLTGSASFTLEAGDFSRTVTLNAAGFARIE